MQKKKYPIEGVVYSISSDKAGWYHYPFSTGNNGVLLRKLKGALNG